MGNLSNYCNLLEKRSLKVQIKTKNNQSTKGNNIEFRNQTFTFAILSCCTALRECDGILPEVWINTVQHSEELICNIFRRPKDSRTVFFVLKKYIPPFTDRNILLLKGWQCLRKYAPPVITKILQLQSYT